MVGLIRRFSMLLGIASMGCNAIVGLGDYEKVSCAHPPCEDAAVSDDVATADSAGPEVASDSAGDDAITLPDGRVCKGHDEDEDGIPDECDSCPNVKNPGQEGGAIGDVCAPSTFSSGIRLLFDPMMELGAWSLLGSGLGTFAVAPEGDAFTGGMVGNEIRAAVAPAATGDAAVEATSILSIVEDSTTLAGVSGLLIRLNGGTAKHFFMCGVTVSGGFVLARAPDAGCGTTCSPAAMTGSDGKPAAAAFPADVPSGLGKRIGVRLSITSGVGTTSGQATCRVFDPDAPATLRSSDSKHSVVAPIDSTKWMTSGDVAVFAIRSRVRFTSIDVVKSF
ncbi:MAG: thrombospondin type 3 repeat-containing protein [Polyangiales bacterium]